jgi:hypothetical protein
MGERIPGDGLLLHATFPQEGGSNTVYGDAGAKAMQGDWKPTSVVFRRMLDDLLDEL